MSENEWSSDEEYNEVPEQRELNMLESEEDSEYEEERQYLLSIMRKKVINFDFPSFEVNNNKEKKVKKVKKIRERKQKNLIDIYTETNNESEKKTWVSKRMKEKKQRDGKIELPKRKFNPKLPLPTLATFKKQQCSINFTQDDFPSL